VIFIRKGRFSKKGKKMSNMYRITDIEAEVERTIDSVREQYETYKPLLEAVFPVLWEWSNTHYSYGTARDERGRAVGLTYSPQPHSIAFAAIDLYLGPDDSITKDVALFAETYIEPIATRMGLDHCEPDSYVGLGWSGLVYRGNGMRLLVRGWFEGSNRCHVIGTGEMLEKQTVVCDG
jgi:hypothetical protein